MEIFSVALNVVTCLAIFVAVWQLLFHARQMHRDLEMHFVAQYWQIMARASTEWRLTHYLGKPVTQSDKHVLYDYLQLCEDEVDLRANARVTDSTWALWAGAIASMVSIEHFAAAVNEAPKNVFPRLRNMMSVMNPDTYDPLKKPLVWRRFHGL